MRTKYQNDTAEAADAIVNDGMADDTYGSVSESPFFHLALVTLDGRHVVIETGEQGFVDVIHEEDAPCNYGRPGKCSTQRFYADEVAAAERRAETASFDADIAYLDDLTRDD